MPNVPAGPAVPPAYTWRDVISDAMVEARWLAVGEQMDADSAAFGLRKLNDLLDEWAARELFAYNVNFTQHTLIANHSPHTIGPVGADFIVNQRPVRLEGATVIFPGSQQVDMPLGIRDDDWWLNQSVKSLTSSIPTDVYYSPDFPNGSLYFWPICTVPLNVLLETWGLISAVSNIGAAVSLPPGYRKAIKLTLAQELDGPRSQDPALAMSAAKAIKAVQSNNAGSPRMATRDAGMPGNRKGGVRSDFNWRSGLRS